MTKCNTELVDGQTRDWHASRGENVNCHNNAKFKVNGKCLCLRHAQQISFDLLIRHQPVTVDEVS